MAGVQGMASPKQVQPMIQTAQAPQGAAIPQAPARPASDEIDYESLANEVMGASQAAPADSGEIDYEALANEVISGSSNPTEQQDKSFYDKMTEGMGGVEKGISNVAYGAAKGILTLPSAIGEAVAEEVKTGKGDLGQSIINAFRPSMKTADLKNSLDTIFPAGANDVMVPMPVIKVSMDEMDEMGMPRKTWDGSSADASVNPNQVLAIAADIAAGEGAFKIAGKVGKGIVSQAPLVDEMIGGWLKARNLAKEAEAVKTGENIAAGLAPKASIAKEQAKDMVQLADEMTQAGIIKKVDGFDVPLAPSQVALKDGKTMVEAEYLSDMPKMQEFFEQQAKGLNDSMEGIFETLSPGYTRGATPKSVPVPNLVKEALKREALDFTATRAQAYKIGKDYLTDTAPLRAVVDDLVADFGIQSHVGQEVIPRAGGPLMGGDRSFPKLAELAVTDKKAWLEKMTSRGYANQYANALFDNLKNIDSLMTQYNGRVPFGKLQKEYSLLKGTVNDLYQSHIIEGGTGYRHSMTKLKNAMQDVYDDGVGKILGGEEQIKYMEKVANYSNIKSTMADFGKAAENEMGASALAKWVFQNEDSASAISRVKGMRDLFEYTGNPEAWNNVSANYLHRVIKDSSGKFGKENVTNWNKVFQRIDKLDPEIQQVLFGKKMNLGLAYNKNGVDVIKDAAALMDAVERGTPTLYKAGSMAEKAVKYNGVKALATIMAPKSSAVKHVSDAVGDTFILADKEARLAEFLSKEGIEDVLKSVPFEKRGFVQSMVDNYVARSRKSKKIKAGKR